MLMHISGKIKETQLYINTFTLRVPLESIVCYSHIYANNFGIKQKVTKYLK